MSLAGPLPRGTHRSPLGEGTPMSTHIQAAQSQAGHQAQHALDIDFVRQRRLASPLGLLLLAAGLAAVLAVAFEYQDARDELAQAEQRQARLLRQLRPDPAARPRAVAQVPARTDGQAVARVQAQLQLPWDAVLRELELLSDPTVALLSIDGQGQTRTLRIAGEARKMADVVAYVGRLRASPWVRTANLSGHEVKQAGALSVIRFALDVSWSTSP